MMKQLATSNLEFQQTMSFSNMQFQQSMNATIQDLKMQIGYRPDLATYPHKPFQIREGMRVQSLEELAPQQLSRSVDADFELDIDSQLLRISRKVEINTPLLDAIKQIPKYPKFLKELCVHKRKKMKGSVEVRALPKKCQDPRIFSVPCTIGDSTFADAMLELGASINVMSTSIYKSLNFGDLEPTGMTIQQENRSIVQPLGVLEDVLIQVNELIFLVDFYVLDMEDETSGKGCTLILG
ncbi:hypothetical protein CR513_03256, partial [Mucuna pruriens]